MAHTININDILVQVRQLDKESQLSLLEKLAALIRKKQENQGPRKLSSISGVGAEIWTNVDIDKYIEHEREW